MSTLPPRHAHALSLIRNPKQAAATAPPATAASNPYQITVSQWTVAYDAQGNLTAQCLLTPDSGVSIDLVVIGVYVNDAALTTIVAGAGGLNLVSGPPDAVWGAFAIAPYPQGHGTTVVSAIIGLASSAPSGFFFQQNFQI